MKLFKLTSILASMMILASCSNFGQKQPETVVVNDLSPVRNFIKHNPVHVPNYRSVGELKITANDGLIWQCVLRDVTGLKPMDYCTKYEGQDMRKALGDQASYPADKNK